MDKFRKRINKSHIQPTKCKSHIQPTKCIITLGINSPAPNGHPRIISQNYTKGIEIIKEDLIKTNFDGKFLYWDKNYPVGSPTHIESPFGFKPYCFQEAFRLGYQLVLWIDSSIRIKQSLCPIFDEIKNQGFLLFQEYHSVGEYCSDAALVTLEITREESFGIRSCRGGVLGLDLNNQKSMKFLNIWKEKASDGITFPGPKWGKISNDRRVNGHRHDQTAASVIAHKLKMLPWKEEAFFDSFFRIDRNSVRTLSE